MDRMITVTEGHGADFKKTEMLESEFNAKYRKNAQAEAEPQTEYDEAAIAAADGAEESAENKSARKKK